MGLEGIWDFWDNWASVELEGIWDALGISLDRDWDQGCIGLFAFRMNDDHYTHPLLFWLAVSVFFPLQK